MELRVLRYFLAVAREESISGAADIAPIMAAVIPSCFIARIMLSPLRFEYS